MKMDKELKKPVYADTQLYKCLKCDNPVSPEIGKEEFCETCGSPILNTCTNNYCINVDNPLPIKAAFCPLCGSKTVFAQYGFIKNPYIPDQKDVPF